MIDYHTQSVAMHPRIIVFHKTWYYYTYELDKKPQEFCVIITTFGEYKHKHLPMGRKSNPVFAQKVMRQMVFDDIGVYLDDQMNIWDKVISHLKAYGFMPNPLKYKVPL